ncbi:MAG: hypothetical protein FWC34_01815 [Bacteroidetes bacterium]|nr:hypothetical protein [Bacteroidota bacterium]MCL2303601.1 hypothetical protein [Lentimicrobiaceae bacterium]
MTGTRTSRGKEVEGAAAVNIIKDKVLSAAAPSTSPITRMCMVIPNEALAK